MTMDKAKWTLASVWLGGAGLIFLILVVQSMRDYYGSRAEDAWSWYLPTVMPALSLIIGVLVADFKVDRGHPIEALRPMMRLGIGISLFYLSMVLLTLLIQPFVDTIAPLDLMRRSNLWLAPLQGLTVAVLGAFFRTR